MPGFTADRVLMAILNRYEGVAVIDEAGETAILYNPGGRLPRGAQFAAIRQRDSEQDSASALSRVGMYRLDIAADKPRFIALFGDLPDKPAKGEVVAGGWDFTQRDVPMPHPLLGASSWICVLNPSQPTFDDCLVLLDAAYAKAKANYARRLKREQD